MEIRPTRNFHKPEILAELNDNPLIRMNLPLPSLHENRKIYVNASSLSYHWALCWKGWILRFSDGWIELVTVNYCTLWKLRLEWKSRLEKNPCLCIMSCLFYLLWSFWILLLFMQGSELLWTMFDLGIYLMNEWLEPDKKIVAFLSSVFSSSDAPLQHW